MQDAINYFKKTMGTSLAPARVYAPVFGDNDIIATEMEFDDIEAAARFLEWVDSDAQEDVIKRGWYDISAGNVVEMWKVIS